MSFDVRHERLAHRRGVAYALGAALSFGASAPLSKALIAEIDPWLMAGLLYAGAGIGLSLLGALTRATERGAPREARLAGVGWLWFLAAAVLGGGVGPVLLMVGLSHTPASTASLLLNLEVVLTVLIAGALFREQIGRWVVLGIVAIVAGGIVLGGQGRVDAGGFIGPLAVAGACLCWGLDNNLTRKIALGDPLQIARLRGLLAGSVNIGLALALGASLPAAGLMVAAGALGLFGFGASLVLFVLGLRELGAARTVAIFAIAPFIGASISVTGLGEPLTWRLATAGLCMALGLWLMLRERHEHEHEHRPMTHAHRHRHDRHHRHAHATGDPPGEPHNHVHSHGRLKHSHAHAPDEHHRHRH